MSIIGPSDGALACPLSHPCRYARPPPFFPARKHDPMLLRYLRGAMGVFGLGDCFGVHNLSRNLAIRDIRSRDGVVRCRALSVLFCWWCSDGGVAVHAAADPSATGGLPALEPELRSGGNGALRLLLHTGGCWPFAPCLRNDHELTSVACHRPSMSTGWTRLSWRRSSPGSRRPSPRCAGARASAVRALPFSPRSSGATLLVHC